PVSPITFTDPIDSKLHLSVVAKDYKARIVDGRYFFSPEAGSVLPAGMQTLSVTFIPANIYKYRNVQETRIIEVKKKRPTIFWKPDNSLLYIVYRTPLAIDIFQGLECEILDGTYTFSHKPGDILEVGIHTILLEYEPNDEYRND